MKHFLRIAAVLFLLGLLFLGGLLIYVEVNQQTLITKVKEKLDQNINGELSIGKIRLTIFKEFPKLSLTIQDLSIKDSVYKKEMLAADKIFLRMNPMQLFRKQIDFSKISLEGGRFYLLRDSSGYINTQVFRFNGGNTNLDFDLKEIDIRNLQFSFHEHKRGQHISFTLVQLSGTVSASGNPPIMSVYGLMKIDSMMFRPDRGSFFKNKTAGLELNLSLDNGKKQLVIHPSKFEIDKQFYDGKGYFDFKENPGLLHLELWNPKTNYYIAKGILSDVIQSYMEGIDVKDPVDVKVNVHGTVNPDFPPEIDAHFNLNNASMSYGGVHFTDLTMKGLFMNHVVPGVKNDDPNSALKFEVPHVKVEGIPLSAQMTITNLVALHLAVTASSQTSLQSLNSIIPGNSYRFTNGDLDLSLSYRGTLSAYVKETARKGEDTITGYLKVNNGAWAYAVRELELKNINADFAFDQLKIGINNLSGALNGNQIFITGYVDGVTRLISNRNQKMMANLKLNAPQFNLSKVLTQKNISQLQSMPKDTTGNSAKVASAAIARLIDDITLRLNFTSNRFTFQKFVANKVGGEVVISVNGMQLKNFNLNACNGNITVNGGLQTNTKTDKLTAELRVKNVNVKEFMSNADNFYQTAITSDNLNGNLSATVRFSSPLDASYTPVTDSMKGHIYFSLHGGRITNFEPLADIGKFIFKKRDFNNVSFDEIKDTVILNGMNLTIQRMEIASSILRMFIQGRYRVNGAADLTIQVPLNNLKKQDLNYTPTNIGVDAKTGASIFLRVRGGGKEKVKVTWDGNAKNRLKKEGLL